MTLASMAAESFLLLLQLHFDVKAHEVSVFTVVLLMHYNYRCDQKAKFDFFSPTGKVCHRERQIILW